MNKLIKISLILSSLFLLFVGVEVSAADELGGTSFYKKVQHPENQITDGEALNLMMKPGQKQKVSVEIINTTDKPIVVESRLSGARTNGNGGLEYAPNKFGKDKSMKYDLPDLVKIPSEVKVPANGKANLDIDISMPKTSYDGIVTGGIQLMEKNSQTETTDDQGATIVNKMAFLFGVTLQMSENEVSPDFDLVNVKPGLQNYRNAIFVDIGNKQSMIAKDLTLDVNISKKGKKESLYQKKTTTMSMAPNSLLSYPVTMDGDRMVAGDYTAHVILSGYNQQWEWSKDFTITDEEADKFNQQDPYLVQERGLNWKLVAVIVLSIVLVTLLIVLIIRFTKKSKKKHKK